MIRYEKTLAEQRIIETIGSDTYIGVSAGGSKESEGKWSIKKISSGSRTVIQYPEGNSAPVYQWSLKDTYEYYIS